VYFLRSGFTKSPGSATLFWLGDQLVTWDAYDGLASVCVCVCVCVCASLRVVVVCVVCVHVCLAVFVSVYVPM
jgi:hypothetical protein